MKVEILFKDGSLKQIHNVKKASNSSTNISTDWLYVYCNGDLDGRPSYRYPMYKIVCVEVSVK